MPIRKAERGNTRAEGMMGNQGVKRKLELFGKAGFGKDGLQSERERKGPH